MHRRPLGRARWLAVIGAIAILVGCLLPWYTIGGGPDQLPVHTWSVLNLSENQAAPGILAFLAALLTIALITLPYATGGRPVALDAWPAYLIFLILAVVGVGGWLLQLVSWGGIDPVGLLPANAPGYWIAVVGTIILGRAVFEIHQQPLAP